MKIINVVQGSKEWHEHRAKSFNASDAPAMLGISQYKTRSQLLQEMATGIGQEFDAATERRFANGHRFEALARPVAEQIIGADLYPITASEGKLSASFDGLTLDETICFEHKSLNDSLRKTIFDEIPEQYRAQMEQQLMISGAEKCMFMASKWSAEDILIEECHVWYVSDQAMRDRIVQGWVQFSKDLEAYHHVDATPVAVATPIRDLPVITYKMNGLAVITNLQADVKPAIVSLVEKSKQPLETDQDFADLDLLCKHFADAEEQCKLIAAQVDAEFKDADKFKKDLKELQELMAAARIAGKKRVGTEKESRKLKIISDARAIYTEHVAALETETSPIKLNLAVPDFALEIKGMAKLDKMKSKCSDLVSSGKAIADVVAKDVRHKLANISGEQMKPYFFLFPDLQQIIFKPNDDFTLLITSRIDAHEKQIAAKFEAERAKMQAEEEARAQVTITQAFYAAKEKAEREVAEERAKAEADQRAKPQVAKSEQAVPLQKQSSQSQSSPPNKRPSEKDLINFIAEHYEVSRQDVREWIIEIAESLKVTA